MFRVNFWLKTIISILFIVSIIFLNSYYLWYVLFLYLLILGIIDKNYRSLAGVIFIPIFLLFFAYDFKTKIILKVLGVVVVSLLWFFSFNKEEKNWLKGLFKNKSNRSKRDFKNMVLKSVVEENKEKVKEYYDEELIINNKVKEDIDRKYLLARIRFLGSNYKNNRIVKKFSSYDLLFFIFSAVILVILWWYR